jgi:predicted RecA/RadA family phage recombinase
MKNLIQEGDELVLTAPYARLSGEAAQIGGIFGVATQDVASGADATFVIEGVVEITKATGAVTQGQKMYWDATAKNITTVSTANTLIGCATQAALSGDATCRVRLSVV